jgi:multiple sugar transport system substrate-binding protein
MTKNGQRRPHAALKTFAIAATAAIGLAGCAGGGGGGTGGGGGGGGTTEISYGFWDEEQAPAMESIIEAFEAENPDINVTTQVTPWEQYWTKLQTAATGGAAPDVFWMTNAYFPQYADGGALASLQSLVDDGAIDMSTFNDAMAEAYTFDGEVYGVPKDIDSIGLWYNKTMFDEAGIDYPDETWTWEKTHEAAEQLTDEDAGVWGIAASFSDQQAWLTTIPQAGGSILLEDGTKSGFNTPEAIEGIQYWVDFIEEGSSPTLQQMTDTDALSMFTSGKVAMLYDGSWTAIVMKTTPYALENVDVAPLPQGKVPGGVVNGLANVMFAGTEKQEAAGKFLAFLGSEEAATIQAETGTVIPATKGAADAWVAAYPEFNAESFLGGLEVGSPMPSTLNTAEWRAYAEEQLTKAWTLEEPVEVVTERIAARMDEILAAEQEG